MSKNKDESMKLSTFELEMTIGVLNQRPPKGIGIKDMKLVHGTVKKLRSFMPKKPEMPEMPKAEEGKKLTDEQIKEKTSLINQYKEDLQSYNDLEVSVDLSSTDKLVIKQRLGSYSGFTPDEKTREKVIGLAEKFGL